MEKKQNNTFILMLIEKKLLNTIKIHADQR